MVNATPRQNLLSTSEKFNLDPTNFDDRFCRETYAHFLQASVPRQNVIKAKKFPFATKVADRNKGMLCALDACVPYVLHFFEKSHKHLVLEFDI